jgi:O-antigen ligase
MPSRRRPPRALSFSLPFLLLVGLLVMLALAGGASRPDVPGQVIVRGAAAVALTIAALFAHRPAERAPLIVLALLATAAILALLQLIPLPPAWWSALPGHSLFLEATTGNQPWRPLSIQPGATVNALMSLIVPAAVILLALATHRLEREKVMAALLVLIAVSAVLGLVQFSGSAFNSPFVNDSPGEVSALFANRNHFALFLAFGCLLAPVWGAWTEHHASWRIPLALGMMILFLLLILASGSRAGLALGMVGTVIGLIMARQMTHRLRRRLPRWTEPAIGAVLIVTVTVFITASLFSGRAQSIDRLLAVDTAGDMRSRGLPTVIETAQTYFPTGAGYGSFDTAFRIHEPFDLLKPTYFNHAHDEYVEILIDGGLPALLLMLIAIGWWLIASVTVWRRKPSSQVTLGRVGSSLLLLTAAASVFDYPARTPMIMAIMVLAAVWLEWGTAVQTALPTNKPDL